MYTPFYYMYSSFLAQVSNDDPFVALEIRNFGPAKEASQEGLHPTVYLISFVEDVPQLR